MNNWTPILWGLTCAVTVGAVDRFMVLGREFKRGEFLQTFQQRFAAYFNGGRQRDENYQWLMTNMAEIESHAWRFGVDELETARLCARDELSGSHGAASTG